MIEILDVYPTGIAFRIQGAITAEDYQKVKPVVVAIVEREGAYRALVEISEPCHLTLGAIWEDLKFDFRYFRRTKRIAFISEKPKRWLWLTSIPFVTDGVRFFTPKDIGLAQAWAFEDV